MAKEGHSAEIEGNRSSPTSWESSLFSHVEQGLKRNPHKIAIRCMHQPASHLSDLILAASVERDDGVQNQGNDRHDLDCLALTYAQVHNAALLLAAGMMANGARHGSTILTLIPNGGEYAILLWASIITRLTLTSLDPSALDVPSSGELRNLMKTLNPEIVVVPNANDAESFDLTIEDLGLKRQQILCISLEGDVFPPSNWKSLRHLAADGLSHPMDKESLLEHARNDDPDRIHSVLFTSGTSVGSPKGCPQRVGSMSHILHSQSWLIDSENSSRVLQQAHNSRAIALQVTLQTWRAGGGVVFASSKSFAIEHTLDGILRHRVTFIVLSPAMVYSLDTLLSSLGPCRRAVGSVQTVHVGGDAVTRDVLMKTANLFPNAKVCINQGMTEGGGFFEWPFFHATSVPKIPHFGEICPIGIVAPGARLRICEPNDRAAVEKGVPGELHVCCESIIQGYLGGEDKSSFYEDGDGRWFITGDIAMVDEENLVYLLGRSKEVIKSGDASIIPALLESCIEKYTGAQAIVVAIPHATLGHEAFAVLTGFNGKSENDINLSVLQALGKTYIPAGVFSLRQIGLDEAPVNATHKIIKTEVRSALLRYLRKTNDD